MILAWVWRWINRWMCSAENSTPHTSHSKSQEHASCSCSLSYTLTLSVWVVSKGSMGRHHVSGDTKDGFSIRSHLPFLFFIPLWIGYKVSSTGIHVKNTWSPAGGTLVGVWWLMLIVNLSVSRITVGTNLWACLWGSFWIRLTEARRPSLTVVVPFSRWSSQL